MIPSPLTRAAFARSVTYERWDGTEWLESEIVDWRILRMMYPGQALRGRQGRLVVREYHPMKRATAR